MADPTLILTDSQGHDLQAVSDVVLDLAYGDDENDFTLIVRDSIDMTRFTRGSRVYIDGTEYGGVVDTVTSSVTTSGSVIQYSGRTWQGLLAYKILSPDTGQDYLTVSGSVSSVLTSLFSRIKLDSVFVADPDTRQISYQFERFTDAWTGLRKMAKASSLKPHMSYIKGRVHVSLLPVKTYDDVVDSDLLDFTATKNYRPVNHLIGLGTGELKNRAVSHWYADSKGTVSETQSLFGLDEVVEIYDYSNAEAKELKEETRKKLEELQSEGTIEVTLHDSDVTLDLGDNVAARDNTTGLTVTSEVSKKIIKIEGGVLSVNYEVGENSTSQSLSGSSESSGGGLAYTAGNGIDITNHVVTAEVTQSELDSVSSDAATAVRQVSDLTADVGAAQQTADTALADAAAAQSTADVATMTASSAVQSISAASPLKATRSGNIITLSAPAATPTSGGWMRMLDKAKLDGIDEGANNYALPAATTSTLGGVKPDGKTITVSSDGTITAQSEGAAASFLAAWPIGSIYHTSRSTNPGDVNGGTWRSLPSQGGYLWERLT